MEVEANDATTFCMLAIAQRRVRSRARSVRRRLTVLESEEQEPASTTQEAAAEPTAAPAQEQPKTESQAEAQPAATQAPTLDMPNLGKAPEITLTGWFNSEPITMASPGGQAAALVVFWTYT